MVILSEAPTQTALHGLLELLSNYPWWEILLFWLVLNFPSIIAWFEQRSHTGSTKKLYEKYLSDKDKEIERQAGRIKELENLVLKTKRK
jgi:hypothetical protein